MSKTVIINAGIGAWYPKGSDRLERSLIHHGYSGDILRWNDAWPNNNFSKDCIYNIKAAAFQEAIKRGYEQILWLDCSVWALRDPDEMFRVMNDNGGFYSPMCGYNAAQMCSDKCLEYFDVTRDEAEGMAGVSSGCLGINMGSEMGAVFIEQFLDAARAGAFSGSRLHDNQSRDSRFLFHRQDQSAATIIANQMGAKLFPMDVHFSYYREDLPKSVIFACRGL